MVKYQHINRNNQYYNIVREQLSDYKDNKDCIDEDQYNLGYEY